MTKKEVKILHRHTPNELRITHKRCWYPFHWRTSIRVEKKSDIEANKKYKKDMIIISITCFIGLIILVVIIKSII